MGTQFVNIDCSRGAPMGRAEYGIASDCPPKSIRLFKVRLFGDYDDGGAYWGASIAVGYLYCARYGTTYRRFTRAYSREHAAKLMRIDRTLLIIGGTPIDN